MWHTVVGIMALNFEKLSSNLHVYNIEKKRIGDWSFPSKELAYIG
jgi:hypothetical protein